MTDLAPIESSKPRWPVIISWAVIIFTVGFIVTAQYLPEIRGKKRVVRSVSGSNMQLELLAKYTVGAKVIAPQSGPQLAESLGPQLDLLCKTEQDRLRAAILVGELQGAEAAGRRLAQIDLGDNPIRRPDLETLRIVYGQSPAQLDETRRQELLARHQFFGRLALVYGLPDADPQRAQVLAIGKRVAITVLAWAMTMFALIAVGVAALIVLIILLAIGIIRLRFVPQRIWSSAYLEAFAIYLAGYLLLGVVVAKLLPNLNWMLASGFTIILLPLVMFWARWRGNSWADVRQAFGWHGGAGWWIEVPLGFAGYVAGLPIVCIGMLITFVLIRISGAAPSHPIVEEVQRGGRPQMIGLFLLACVWAPVFEETMFRGALFAHLRQRWGWWISAPIVALIFAAIHPQGWAAIPLLGSIAIVLAALREWRGSILAPIICHACVNFGTMMLLTLVK